MEIFESKVPFSFNQVICVTDFWWEKLGTILWDTFINRSTVSV